MYTMRNKGYSTTLEDSMLGTTCVDKYEYEYDDTKLVQLLLFVDQLTVAHA